MGFESPAVNKAWKKDETAALIALYESEKCLYDKSDPDYYDITKRTDAYERIRQVMLRIRPDCALIQIKNRIKYVRSQYAAEKLRRDISIQSGLCTEETYKPEMWCFGLLQFLDDYLTPKRKKIEIEEIEDEVNKESDTEDIEYEGVTNRSENQNHQDEAGSSLATDENSNDHENIINGGNNKKKRKQNNVLASPKKVLNEDEKSVENSYDREDIFGQYVASEMRALRDNPLLYLQTKQSILEILTSANFELINPE